MSYQNAYVENNRMEDNAADPKRRSADCVITQFFIFREEVHLGWDCFYKEKITIGSSENADLILKGGDIADIHAVVCLKNSQIVVTSENSNQSVLVNHQSVETAILGRFDYLDIGPYTIKIKLLASEKPQARQPKVPDPIQPNQPAEEPSGEATIELEAFESSAHDESVGLTDEASVNLEMKELLELAETLSQPAEQSCETDQPKPDHLKPSEKQTKVQKTISRKHFYPDRKEDQGVSASDARHHEIVTENKPLAKPDAMEVATDDKERTKRNGKFRVVYQGEVSGEYTPQEVKENLKKIFGAEESKISWIDSKTKIVVKKELSHYDALKICALLEKAGAKASLEKMEALDAKEHPGRVIPETKIDNNPEHPVVKYQHRHDSEEEDEEEDLEARFTLKNMILQESKTSSGTNQELNVEVTKFRNNTIIDIFFLKPKNKYYIRSQNQKFTLAENDRKGGCWFYYSDHVWGTIQTGAAEAVKTDNLKRTENIYHKNKGFYKHPITIGDIVTITDGVFEYIIRPFYAEDSPEVALPEQEEKIFHKYMIKSSIVHLFFLVFIGLFHSVKQPEPLPPETHFVKIDAMELSQITKKKKPVPPPVVKPQKQEPKVEKKVAVKKTPTKTLAVASKKSKPTRKPVVSRSPKAGGGFGKGNISNRNINQTGLLSMLGDSVGIKPQTAMAAVTNLDAVSTVYSGKANFKVGGIVGKLGNARIEIPQTGVVSTKGSSQVLRSAGAGGVGTVAALEKGQTGQKQVQGMVSAQLTKAVGVQGGMSREAVKRVIDQHLDEISYCYETALIGNPSIMGKVIFEWKILTSGKVGMVSIKSSSINSNEIHSCIKAAIKTWQFPEPKGSEVIVSYPFVFDIVGF